jgi:hypothetical protein
MYTSQIVSASCPHLESQCYFHEDKKSIHTKVKFWDLVGSNVMELMEFNGMELVDHNGL